jgi:hypothetical protein
MGIESDQEVVELIGTDFQMIDAITASFEECATNSVFSRTQALECMNSYIFPLLPSPPTLSLVRHLFN